jgi:hypothetical protein
MFRQGSNNNGALTLGMRYGLIIEQKGPALFPGFGTLQS